MPKGNSGEEGSAEVYTVPAKKTAILGAFPYYISREVVTLWAYYFRIPTA